MERGVGTTRLLQHLTELGPLGYAAALGLVDKLTRNDIPVGLSICPERPELRGHREVHVLPVAGHPGVEGCRGEVIL